MALDSVVRGVTSGNGAEVNADNELKVALGQDPESAGFVRMAGNLYLGDVGEDVRVSEDGYVMVGQENLILYDMIEGAALNSQVWTTSVLTQTITQSAGLINLNATTLTTINTYAILTSIKHVPLYGQYPLILNFAIGINVGAQPNATMEFGLGLAATTTAPTDGVFVRVSPQGDVYGVCNYGGVETEIALTFEEGFTPGADLHDWQIVIDNDDIHFFHDRDLVGEMPVPGTQPFPTSNARLPVFARTVCGAVAPATGPRLQIGRVMVVQSVLNQERLWGQALASMGRGAYQSPVTTFSQTANHANSVSPVSAALSNTAAGYTTLGGRFQFAAPAGAVTDFALFAYLVPAGMQLYVSSVSISAVNTGAAVGTTATILDWSIGVNSSAITLITTDTATAWQARRIPLGLQSWEMNDGIGKMAADLVRQFDPPLVVDGGRYLHIIVQVPVGTATASQVIRGDCTIHGVFE